MTTTPSRLPAVAAIAAAFSMVATPTSAAELPVFSATPAHVETGAAEELNHHRYRRWRHRNRVDAGDVIAGVLVLGTIAAIAGSASSRERERERYEPRYRDRDDARYDRRTRRNDRDSYESRGMSRAVDMCVDQVERGDDRVDDVANAARTSDGWRISGSLDNGESWDCWIDNDGRIRSIDLGAPAYSYRGDEAAGQGEPQWSDEAYARARATTRTAVDEGYRYSSAPVAAEGPQPAYPGGPLPGEQDLDGDGYIDGDLAEDGRYDT